MRHLSVADTAKKWNISERSVRNYCAQGRVEGAFLAGKTWRIPENAEKPERSNKKVKPPTTLLDILQPANKKSRVNYGILKVLYRSKTRYQNKTARNVGLKKDIK